jgi:hypothetical protein
LLRATITILFITMTIRLQWQKRKVLCEDDGGGGTERTEDHGAECWMVARSVGRMRCEETMKTVDRSIDRCMRYSY